jgi:hypothetical protein
LYSNSNRGKSITHHNQTKVLTTWFLNLSLDEYIDNTKAQSLNFESKTHEAQLEDQKPRKAQEGHLEEGKTTKPANGMKSGKIKQNGIEELRKLKITKTHKTPPEIDSQCKLSPLDRHYHVSSLNHPVSKEFNQLCAHSLPLW